MLPPETLELVFGHLSQDNLVAVLSACSVFHRVAARLLYRTLLNVPPKRSLRLVNTLVRNDVYPPLVRRFDLEWADNILTANFLRLLHRVLRRLPHLSYLGLEFSASDNTTTSLAWILRQCSFSLRVFTTSMRCDLPLARFLATQPSLVEVCLRGFPPVRRHSISYPDAPDSDSDAEAEAEAEAGSFPLPPGALPCLRHFRTVLASPRLTADFLRGRPVESVSMSLYPGDATASLDALLLSTRPLKRLTVMSFDVGKPAALIEEISRRLPALEALHAVVLVQNSTHEHLLETASSLTHFRALRYLTFMAPGAHSSENESEIAEVWGRACPTLKTIILPKGIVWGYVDGRWVSLQDMS